MAAFVKVSFFLFPPLVGAKCKSGMDGGCDGRTDHQILKWRTAVWIEAMKKVMGYMKT